MRGSSASKIFIREPRSVLYANAGSKKRAQSVLICNDSVEFQLEIPKISRRRLLSPKYADLGQFHVVVLHRTTTKCTKIYNARAQLLFLSLNLLFSDVLVAASSK